MAYSDRELLARLIECEAGGEGDDGMRAVASVIMNRVHAPGGEYARVGKGNLQDIVFQKNQFTCAVTSKNGVPNQQNIYNMRPQQIHYDIADWALAGNRLPPLGTSLWFFNPFSTVCKTNFPSAVGVLTTRIVLHCFYNPTNEYWKT